MKETKSTMDRFRIIENLPTSTIKRESNTNVKRRAFINDVDHRLYSPISNIERIPESAYHVILGVVSCNTRGVFNTGYFLCIVIVCIVLSCRPCLGKSLKGDIKECDIEGAEMNVSLVAEDPCYKCFCRNGQVVCERPTCPSLEGCHAVLFTRPPGACCDVCKGCVVENSVMPHGESWPDATDRCLMRTCHAGVVTTTVEQCRPLCSHPVQVPGQCCPACDGCSVDGQHYISGETFTPQSYPNIECVCKLGSVTCSTRACPVLNCPEWSRVKLDGHRCHTCKGERQIFDVPGSCYMSHRVYSHGDRVMPDRCTSCTCHHGTMMCEREQCQALNCPLSQQVSVPGACCPACVNQQSCDAQGRKVKHGQRWQKDACTSCTCSNGDLRCQVQQCPSLVCQKGYVPVSLEKECCGTCIKKFSTCSIRGKDSDVIQSFDGFRYRTKGYCLHDLVGDCKNNAFNIRGRYERTQEKGPRNINTNNKENRLNLVSINFGATKIKLFRNGKIRINRRWQHMESSKTLRKRNVKRSHGKHSLNDLPNEISVIIKQGKVSVRHKTLGVTVIWRLAINILRVKVHAQRYQGNRHLCGLCGSINHMDNGDSNGITRNQRFEPVLPRYMARAWRRGRGCRKIDRKNKEKNGNSKMSSMNEAEEAALEADLASFFTKLGAVWVNSDDSVNDTIANSHTSKSDGIQAIDNNFKFNEKKNATNIARSDVLNKANEIRLGKKQNELYRLLT